MSWLKKTNQMWKVQAFFICVILGLITLMNLIKAIDSENKIVFASISFFIVFFLALYWLFFSIKCRKCNNYVALKVIKESNLTNWITNLFSIEYCPYCGSNSNDKTLEGEKNQRSDS